VPDGAGVIQYKGKRGVVWRVKYRDAEGRQVMETIGAERDGVTRKQAEAELRERLVRVQRKGYRRPKPRTVGEWSQTWYEEGERRRGWKPGTARAQVPAGSSRSPLRHDAAELDPAAGRRRIREARQQRTVSTLRDRRGDILGRAVAEELIQTNPVAGVERPKAKPIKWRILEPDEVRRVAAAFEDERARAVFLTLHLTGLRRHELQGLPWRHVSLSESTIRVEVSKSEEGERLLSIGPELVAVLEARYQASPYKADADYVFAHQETGARLGADRYRALLRKALEKADIPDRERARPFHDARHAVLTHLALTPEAPRSLC
jgi:site-specific recombinase XerC